MNKIKYLIFIVLHLATLCAMDEQIEIIKKNTTTINLLWVNSEQKEFQDHIIPTSIVKEDKRDNSTLSIDMFKRIEEWLKYFSVTLWFDPVFTNSTQLENTYNRIKLIKNDSKNKITLKSIQDLEIVKREIENPKDYLSDKFSVFGELLPIYYRIDLLKLIIAYESVKDSSNPCAVICTDFSIEPFKNIFDSQTVANIKNYGFVLTESEYNRCSYENCFQIITNSDINILRAINFLIQLSIKKFENFLNSYPVPLSDSKNWFRKEQEEGKTPQQRRDSLAKGLTECCIEEFVFENYRTMMNVLYFLQGKLEINPNNGSIFDIEVPCYKQFLDGTIGMVDSIDLYENCIVKDLSGHLYQIECLKIPKKKVRHIPSHFMKIQQK